MKRVSTLFAILSLLILLGVAAYGAENATWGSVKNFLNEEATPAAKAGPWVAKVTGSGYVSLNDDPSGNDGIPQLPVFFRVNVSAFKYADDSVKGQVKAHLDVFGNTFKYTIDVDCLCIKDNQAFIGGTIVQSSNPAVFPIGLKGLTVLEDNGPNGDIMHSEVDDPEGTRWNDCENPAQAMARTTVDRGNYNVQTR